MSWALSSVILHYVLTTHLTSQATHQGMLKQKGKEQEILSEALGMEKCRSFPSQTMMLASIPNCYVYLLNPGDQETVSSYQNCISIGKCRYLVSLLLGNT